MAITEFHPLSVAFTVRRSFPTWGKEATNDKAFVILTALDPRKNSLFPESSHPRPMEDSWMADLAINPSPQPGDRVLPRPGLWRVSARGQGEESGLHDPPDHVNYRALDSRFPSEPPSPNFLGIMTLFQQTSRYTKKLFDYFSF